MKKFIQHDGGTVIAEYAILIAFVVIVVIVAVAFFSDQLAGKFSELAGALK